MVCVQCVKQGHDLSLQTALGCNVMQRPLNRLSCASLVIAQAQELQMDLLCAKGDTADECDLKDHQLSGDIYVSSSSG